MKTGARLRAFLAVFVAVINTILFGIAVIVFSIVPFWGQKIGENLIRLWVKLFIWITGLEVEYHNIDKYKDKLGVFMPNHQSFLDPVILYNKFPQMKFIVYEEFKKIPIFGLVLFLQGHLFINNGRNRKALETLNQAVLKLRKGTSIIIFPEGERKAKLSVFKKGGFRIASELGLPIIPISISGSWRAMPRGDFLYYKRKIKVTAKEPIHTSEYSPDQMNDLIQKVRDEIAFELESFELEDDMKSKDFN